MSNTQFTSAWNCVFDLDRIAPNAPACKGDEVTSPLTMRSTKKGDGNLILDMRKSETSITKATHPR